MSNEEKIKNPDLSKLSDEDLLKIFETGEIYKKRALPILNEAIQRLLGNKVYKEKYE